MPEPTRIENLRAALDQRLFPTVGLWNRLASVIDGKPVRPHTSLLREGIDAGNPYFINEEEVPPTGTTLALAYSRTRWYDGRVSVWLGAQRGVGRGEGSSGLVFDTLVDTTYP
ncbi:hypothetical protein ACIG5E_14705 [Kitasatospora sp. NPDC053057]|uniref:hypothetical protein n=1 Tax=Kitasatospora sp. NPDC053057 TaxID=3364062 RepID=UPI0037CCA816